MHSIGDLRLLQYANGPRIAASLSNDAGTEHNSQAVIGNKKDEIRPGNNQDIEWANGANRVAFLLEAYGVSGGVTAELPCELQRSAVGWKRVLGGRVE